MNKFNYILCEIHNPYIHGKTLESAYNIENHFLVIGKFDYNTGNDINEDIFNPNIYEMIIFYKRYYISTNFNHPSIRNFCKIIKTTNYIKPEIAQCLLLDSGETIAILKTFWLRIIQRTWKKIFKNKQNILKNRINDSYLYEIGKKKLKFPKLKGLLNKII